MDHQVQETEVAGELLALHPYKCVYWSEEKILWISDLHLGKTNHFQKAGIPIPERVADENWNRLYHVLDWFHPERVLFMGDLFHSSHNKEWEVFGRFIEHFDPIRFDLIVGNHDIMDDRHYEDLGIALYPDLTMGPFYFTHHPQLNFSGYNICGHIHPAVRLRGKARQGVRLPCFYFGEQQGILPAFGAFTGTAVIRPTKKDLVYLIVEDQIVVV